MADTGKTDPKKLADPKAKPAPDTTKPDAPKGAAQTYPPMR